MQDAASDSLIRATLESTEDGILVVDTAGKIVLFNKKFLELWRIPQAILDTRDDRKAIQFVLDQLLAPEDFLAKVDELYAKPDAVSFDVLRFKDGRVFERYSQPQKVGDACVGRVWSFRDVTKRLTAEQALVERTAELEKLVKSMVGREKQMAELKEELAKLKGGKR